MKSLNKKRSINHTWLTQWMLLGFLLFSISSQAFFEREFKWDIENTATDTVLAQVNKKASKKNKWFKKSNFPEFIHQQIKQQPLPKGLAISLSREINFVNNQQLTAYLQSLIDRLLKGWKGPTVPVTVLVEANDNRVLKVDEFNQIVISTGHIKAATSEDYLGVLLGHEMSHILLKHNQSKEIYTNKIPEIIETMGDLSLLKEGIKEKKSGKKNKQIERTATHTAATGWVWSDLMSPIWSRSSEQQADYLALDLVAAAGMNVEVAYRAFADLNKAELALSKRLEALKDILLDNIAQREKLQEKGLTEEQQKEWVGLVNKGVGGVLDAAFTKVAQLRAEHLDAEKRGENASNYVRRFYDDALARTSKKRLATIKKSASLHGVNLAIKAHKQLNKEPPNLNAGLSLSQQAVAKDSGNIYSWLVRYEARKKTNNALKAQQSLELALKNPLAPASMYVNLAGYYQKARRGKDAEAALLKGQNRLGPTARFFPPLIYAALQQNDTDKAKAYKKQCLSLGKSRWKQVAGGIGNMMDIKLNLTSATEQACVGAIGEQNTVVAKTGKQKTTAGQKNKENKSFFGSVMAGVDGVVKKSKSLVNKAK